MKRLSKAVLGVTLLEIMLVLAIAAMLIVMSVRFYNSSNQSNQANTVIGSLQAIQGAVGDLTGGGQYTASAITSATVTGVVPTGTMTTPWGSTISVAYTSATTYTVTIPSISGSICGQIKGRLSSSKNYTSLNCTTTGGAIGTGTFVYDSTQ